MGLFDSISASLGGRDAVGAATRSAQKGIQVIGGSAEAYGVISGAIGNRAARELGSAAGNAASRLPPEVRNAINTTSQVAEIIQQEGLAGLAAQVIDPKRVSGASSNRPKGDSSLYLDTATPLYGGISPKEAKSIQQEAIRTGRAKKNLFLVRVSSPLMGDFSDEFNLFCTDIEHGPVTLTGDKLKVGATVIDSATGTEVDEIRMTTMDDKKEQSASGSVPTQTPSQVQMGPLAYLPITRLRSRSLIPLWAISAGSGPRGYSARSATRFPCRAARMHSKKCR